MSAKTMSSRRTIEKIAKFDKDAADYLQEERLRRFKNDMAARQIVLRWSKYFTVCHIHENIEIGQGPDWWRRDGRLLQELPTACPGVAQHLGRRPDRFRKNLQKESNRSQARKKASSTGSFS